MPVGIVRIFIAHNVNICSGSDALNINFTE